MVWQYVPHWRILCSCVGLKNIWVPLYICSGKHETYNSIGGTKCCGKFRSGKNDDVDPNPCGCPGIRKKEIKLITLHEGTFFNAREWPRIQSF